MFPPGEFVKAVGDAACAEEEFPLAFLKIVGESLGGSEATPEGRKDRRTSAQSIAAGTLIRSHGS